MNWSTVVKNKPKNIIQSSPNHTPTATSNHQKSFQITEAVENKENQRRIDSEVLVTGFTAEPAKNHWKELISTTNIDTQEVESHATFSQNGKYFITIGFNDEEVQEDFIEAINRKNSRNKNLSTKIHAHNRLTKFNSSVLKELRSLRKSAAISDYKLDRHLFSAKLTDSSPWIIIDTQHKLQTFIEAANEFQKDVGQSERLTNLKDQQALDRQIILQGFPYLPTKVDDVIARFMRHFNLSFKHVTGFRVLRSKNSEQILIQLSEKSIQMEILAPNERKIQLKELMPENSSNMNITWDRVVTEFNEYVCQKLTKGLRENKIEKFDFVGYRFCVQVDQFSPWMPIGCNSDLDGIFEPKMTKTSSIGSLSTSLSVLSVSSSGD